MVRRVPEKEYARGDKVDVLADIGSLVARGVVVRAVQTDYGTRWEVRAEGRVYVASRFNLRPTKEGLER